MKISVVSGGSRNGCKCGSRFDHWRKFSGQAVPAYCPEHSCHNRVLLGALVRKEGCNDKEVYIIPLCEEHCRSANTLTVTSACELVPADVSKTCGKDR